MRNEIQRETEILKTKAPTLKLKSNLGFFNYLAGKVGAFSLGGDL